MGLALIYFGVFAANSAHILELLWTKYIFHKTVDFREARFCLSSLIIRETEKSVLTIFANWENETLS